MSKKTNTPNKQYKTIKVVTLVKIAVSIAALLVAFYLGSVSEKAYADQYHSDVKASAKKLITDLK